MSASTYSDYTPVGPWADGTVVVRNDDGVGFTYSASLNALTVNPNLSYSIKNANDNIIENLPTPVNTGDAANKAYVDAHAGGGGGIPEAPTDGQQYGRQSSAWSVIVPNPSASTTTPAMDGTATIGTSTTYARADHIHPSDTTRAPLVSPAFTGTPTAPTPTSGTNSTQIATTAFVETAIGGIAVPPSPSSSIPVMDGIGSAGSAVTYARGDHVHPSDTSLLPLAGGTLTGPLILAADPTTALGAATKQYVDAHAGSGGGIPEAPTDGSYYLRDGATAAWTNVIDCGTF